MRGKVLCTENRAKGIIAIISILCLITTGSTSFEYQLNLKEHCEQEVCKSNLNKFPTKSFVQSGSAYEKNPQIQTTTTAAPLTTPTTTRLKIRDKNRGHQTEQNLNKKLLKLIDDITLNLNHRIYRNVPHLPENITKDVPCIVPKNEPKSPTCPGNQTDCSSQPEESNVTVPEDVNLNDSCCIKSYTIHTEPTNLGNNETYLAVVNWFSSIVFGLLPLFLIATFNCFLVNAVYKSQKKRKLLTNLQVSEKQIIFGKFCKLCFLLQEHVTQYQENRITLLLISVVVLFLLCQTPTASFLIYDALDETADVHTRNVKKGTRSFVSRHSFVSYYFQFSKSPSIFVSFYKVTAKKVQKMRLCLLKSHFLVSF